MPATYLGWFRRGPGAGTSEHGSAWLWEDTDDTQLVTFLTDAIDEFAYAPSLGNFNVDRTGSSPILRWEWFRQGSDTDWEWVPSGQYGSLPLVVGEYINPLDYVVNYPRPPEANPFEGAGELVTIWDTTGKWESDQYGRPYNLNDLLA